MGVAAVRLPTATFHLAPAIVAAWPAGTQRPRDVALPLAAMGLALASAASALLAIGGYLQGPSLLPFGGALAESLVGATLGALVGLAVNLTQSAVPASQT